MLNAVDEEVHRITDECYAEARRILRDNRDKLDAIVKQLLIHETLDEPDVYAAAGICGPRPRASAAKLRRGRLHVSDCSAWHAFPMRARIESRCG